MVVLQKMQNSIFNTLSLVRPFFRQNGVCALNAGSVFCVLRPKYRRKDNYVFFIKVAVHNCQISVSLRFDSNKI